MANLHTASQRIHVLEMLGNAIVGGMETYVMRLIQNLPRDQFAITVMFPWENEMADRMRDLGVDVFVTPMPENPPWSGIQMTSALIKAHNVDVVHAHLPNAHLLAGLAGKLTGCPVVSTIHGRQLTTLDLEVHRTAGTHLSAVCRQTYFHALGLGVHPSQLHFIPNGVDTRVFTTQRERQGPLRRSLGISPDATLVAQVGRLSPEKGPDVFLRAALAIKQAAPQAQFALIGDGPLRAEMQALIERFELQGTVHMPGLLADMSAVYAELDMVVSASRSEAMPLAMMEAMSCGLPVIATRVGGVPDLIQHGKTGWLVGDGDFDAIARHVIDLADKPVERAAMGERARSRMVANFSLDESVKATVQLLSRLAHKPVEQRRVGPLLNGTKAHTVHGLNGVLAEPDKAATG
jgi:glycosyltransferase involved in cell wall biosynthesis